jgi:hypothetical protein
VRAARESSGARDGGAEPVRHGTPPIKFRSFLRFLSRLHPINAYWNSPEGLAECHPAVARRLGGRHQNAGACPRTCGGVTPAPVVMMFKIRASADQLDALTGDLETILDGDDAEDAA